MVYIPNADADRQNEPEPVEEGTYSIEVADVYERETRAGDPMWRLALRVVEGPNAGAIIYDNLIFSEKGIPKALAMFKAAGLDASGGRDYQPAEINGRRCQVSVYVKEIEDEEGFSRRVNQVPFTGYGPPIESDGARHGLPEF